MPPKKNTKKAPAAAAGGKKTQKISFALAAAEEATRAVHTTRHVRFAGEAPAAKKAPAGKKAALVQGSGVVMAAAKAGKRPRPEDDEAAEEDLYEQQSAEEQSEEDEAASLVDDSSSDDGSSDAGSDAEEDNLSDLADAEDGDSDDDDDDDDDENPFVRAKRTGAKLSYKVLRLRFLPQEFQEPQLFKFLGQFGAEVLNCFCVRSRRTHQSKGIAYVHFDNEDVLPRVLEECDGMALGGRAVRARVVTLHRPMPTKEKVAQRRKLAYAYKTKGAPLKQHNVSSKNPVGLLIKAARTEASNNAYLKTLGIDFTTDMFTAQLKTVPASLITKNTKVLVDAGAVAGRNGSSEAPAAAPSPTKAAATPRKSAGGKGATPEKAKASPAKAAASPAAAKVKTPSRTPTRSAPSSGKKAARKSA